MLNLSISTVSRALKNHPDISVDTKIKVKELAAIVDYEPNTYAINLRTNSSKEFGVIIPAISNDFYQSFISSLEEEARLYGNTLIIMQSGEDPVIELENLKRCKQNRMAGVFVSITTKTVDILNFCQCGSVSPRGSRSASNATHGMYHNWYVYANAPFRGHGI